MIWRHCFKKESTTIFKSKLDILKCWNIHIMIILVVLYIGVLCYIEKNRNDILIQDKRLRNRIFYCRIKLCDKTNIFSQFYCTQRNRYYTFIYEKKRKKKGSLLLLLTIMASVHCVIMMFNIRYKLYAAEFRLARKYTKL